MAAQPADNPLQKPAPRARPAHNPPRGCCSRPSDGTKRAQRPCNRLAGALEIGTPRPHVTSVSPCWPQALGYPTVLLTLRALIFQPVFNPRLIASLQGVNSLRYSQIHIPRIVENAAAVAAADQVFLALASHKQLRR